MQVFSQGLFQTSLSFKAGRTGITKFGWSRENPPQYRIKLSKQDFKSLKTMQPGENLVKKVATILVGHSDSAPRFALIPNITDFAKSEEQIRKFQENLSKAVFRYQKKYFPQEISNHTKWDHEFVAHELDGINPQQAGKHRYTSTKRLHWDVCAPFNSLAYGPNENVSGGLPTFADVRQYLRDTGLKLKDIVTLIPYKTNLTIQAKHMARIRKDYMVTVEDMDPVNGRPIIFFNDRPETGGIMHGATWARKTDPSKPAKRPLYLAAYLSLKDIKAGYKSLGMWEWHQLLKGKGRFFLPR